jgi:hypothetical protein
MWHTKEENNLTFNQNQYNMKNSNIIKNKKFTSIRKAKKAIRKKSYKSQTIHVELSKEIINRLGKPTTYKVYFTTSHKDKPQQKFSCHKVYNGGRTKYCF